jgi:peptide/nickel transport system substrate-binding protein
LIAALALTLSTALAVSAGAAGAAAAKNSKADVCNASRVGGTMTFGQYSIGTSLDPAFRQSGGAGGISVLSGVYDELMKSDPKTGEVTPYLAQSLTANKDFTSFVLKLRPGIKFGDGNALDAAAVVAAHTRYITPGNTFAGFAPYFQSIVATDPMTVTYTMTSPFSDLATQMSTTFGMIADPAAVAKYGSAFGGTPNSGAGVGPYDVTTFSPPTSVVMKAKQNYWQGPVCIDTINNTTTTGSQQGYDSFVTGQYDMAYLRDPVVYNTYKNLKPKVGHDQPVLQTGGVAVWMNLQAKASHMDDPRVRQALSLATDATQINQRAYQGTVITHTSISPKEDTVNGATKAPPFNPTKAAQLVSQVKQETGWDGSIRLLCSATPPTPDFGIALAAQWTAAGFKVNLDTTLPVTPFTVKVGVAHDFDTACGANQIAGGDVFDGLFVRVGPAPGSYTGWVQGSNPAYDASIKQLLSNPIGTAGYKKGMDMMQAVFTKDVPNIPIGSFYEDALMQNKVHGVEFSAKGIALFGKAYLAKS